MTSNFRFRVWNEFSNDLKKEWNYLFSLSQNSFFQDYNWQSLWFDEIIKKNKKKSIIIVGLYDNEKIIAIFPFEIKKFFNLNILCLTGFPFADYLDCLIDENFLYLNSGLENKLFEFLKIQKIADIIQFNNLTIKSNFLKFLKDIKFEKSSFRAFQIIKKQNQIELINKKFVLDTKRQIKRLNSLGNLSFKISNNEIEKKRIIEFFFSHKEKQLIKTNNWNYLKNKNYRNFLYKLFLKNYGHVSYIELNKEIIAVHLGFLENNKFLYIFPTYSEKFLNYSPGNILLFNLINFFFNNGGELFDFTIGNEFYKKKLSNNMINIYYKNLPITFYGKFLIPFLSLKDNLKKIRLINYLFRKIRY